MPVRTHLFTAYLFVFSALNCFSTEVTTNIDEDDGNLLPTNGSGTSLREAINHSPAGTTITFNPALSGQTVTLTNGQLNITKNLTIDASPLSSSIIISGDDNFRVMQINTGIVATIDSLTISNADAPFVPPNDSGAGIFNQGSLTLNNSTLSENFSSRYGGGIHNEGTLTVNQSIISDNYADFGGAISNMGTLIINQSTLSRNYVEVLGGGIFNDATAILNQSTILRNGGFEGGGILNYGSLTLNQSTLSQNSAYRGGGIYTGVTLILNQSTLSANTASFGGGIYSNSSLTPSTLSLNNSLIAGNSRYSDGAGPDIQLHAGTYDSNTGVNFIGDTTGAGIIPGSVITGNPLLAPLDNYGGPTQTMPPLPSSPVIDTAGITSFTTDQRDAPRIIGLASDIGSVEAFPFSSIPIVDTDNDGLDDRLEEGFFDDLTTANETTDFDKDGSLDIEELRNMTNPLDLQSLFRITSFTKATGFDPLTNPVFDLSFTSFSGLTYSARHKSSLQGNFLPLGTPTEADDSTTTLKVTLDPTKDFIQVTRE